MNLCRRTFLSTATAAMGASALHAGRVGTDAQLRVGVLSDIHITTPASAKYFRAALEWFRDKGADAVIIAGDMADWGLKAQLKVVAETWYAVFPSDKAPDGRPVEKLFVYGNHDIEGWKYGYVKKQTAEKRAELEADAIEKLGRAQVWEDLFHEKYEPVWRKTVKGYTFIGGHFTSWQQVEGIDAKLNAICPTLDPVKPFFYIQHIHLKDTCSAPWTWGQDGGLATKTLSAYPNAFALSGHSHTSLSDERTIWQGAFTSVGTASLSYLLGFSARENGFCLNDRADADPVPQMPRLKTDNGKQGMFMTVYPDRITLERHEFVYNGSVGADWVVPLPITERRALRFDVRAQAAVPPKFAADARAAISEPFDGKNRKGTPTKQVTVTFPPVVSQGTHPRAYDYEVQLEARQCDMLNIFRTKHVYSKNYYLPESQETEPVTCVFALSEIPKQTQVRFAIRPVECFGKKGDALYTPWKVFPR